MTKFYLITKDALDPKDHHTIIPIVYNYDETDYLCWLINLSKDELYGLEYDNYYQYHKFASARWKPYHKHEIPLWNFLKTKHSFEVINKNSNKAEFGINSFDLDEYDLMYMKLLQ